MQRILRIELLAGKMLIEECPNFAVAKNVFHALGEVTVGSSYKNKDRFINVTGYFSRYAPVTINKAGPFSFVGKSSQKKDQHYAQQ